MDTLRAGLQAAYAAARHDLGPKLVALVAAYLVLKLAQFAFERRRLHKTFERMRVPHARPHPISGNLRDTRRVPYVKYAHKLHEKQGDNVGYFIGGDPFLATKDLELIQQVFVAKSRLFYDRMPFYLNVEPVPDNLICQRGDRWRYMRKLLTPAFASSKIKSSQFYWDAQKTFEKMRDQVDRNAKRKADGARVTLVEDVYDRMAAVALDMICKTAFHMDNMISFDGPLEFGRKFSLGKPASWIARDRPQDAFLNTSKRAVGLAFNPLVQLVACLPFLEPVLTFLCKSFVFATIFQVLFERLDYLVRRSNATGALGPPAENATEAPVPSPDGRLVPVSGDAGEQRDLAQKRRIIDSLIEVLRERKITRNEFTGNALVILFAGFETTANAFTFTLWLLARHPEVQAKLREELRARMKAIREQRASGADESALLEGELNELATGCEYLENVVNESLRLYPPVPALSCRRASVDFELSTGLRVEKGVSVIPSVWSIHRDKQIWGERANEFWPERFEMLSVSQVNSAMFMPFGLGPRNCIGKAVAMHEVKIVVGRMILEYSVEVAPKLTPNKLKICSPINITITNSEKIPLNFVKLPAQQLGACNAAPVEVK